MFKTFPYQVNALSAALLFTALSACTSFDNTPTAEELANQEAAKNYASQNGDLSTDAQGNTFFKGQKLIPVTVQNSQDVYNNITVDGIDYTLLVAETERGTAIYGINATSQISDIGHSVDPITNPSDALSAEYAGKYFQRSIDAQGNISPEISGGILLKFDPAAGTLTSTTGPNVSYKWDNQTGAFIGSGSTTGTANIYVNEELLATYQNPKSNTETNYGTIWAIGNNTFNK